MALTLNTKVQGQQTAVLTLTPTQVLKVTINDVEQAQFTTTAPSGVTLAVQVSVRANSTP
jgi:hypothetical protein